MTTLPTTAASCPGKVLLTGGYLVLDRDYTGLVFGLSARIHVHVAPLISSSDIALEEIIVRSPQFREASWEYGYQLIENDGGIQLTSLKRSAQETHHPNPFIETTLSYVLTYISSIDTPKITSVSITILADSEYYTQHEANDVASSQEHRFKDFGVSLSDAHKTGLGSSAALVTALTAALLSHYLPKEAFSPETDQGKSRLHNLAQTAHCAAQGKVGSGFDVASAVYGSCMYRRFSPLLLEKQQGKPGEAGFARQVRALVEESDSEHEWDTEISKSAVKLPPGLRLVMCDVDCGSQTPGMVKKVLAWREKEPEEANMLWQQLHTKNQALAAELVSLAESGSNDFVGLTKIISVIRQLIRDMSRLSCVPIEPESQTQLLDSCTQVDGVVGGVVPGAGGYDAIALLVQDGEETLARLRLTLKAWNNHHDLGGESIGGGAESNAHGRVSILSVREEIAGVQIEDTSRYREWIA